LSQPDSTEQPEARIFTLPRGFPLAIDITRTETPQKKGDYMEKHTFISNREITLGILFSLLAFLGLMALNSTAFAQSTPASPSTSRSVVPEARDATTDQFKPHIGVSLGYAEPESGYDGTTQYGIELGYQPYIPFGAALEVSSFRSDRANADDLRRTTAVLKGTLNFGGDTPFIRHSYIGAGLGAVIDSAGDSETNLGLKFLAGFDIPINRTGVTSRKTFTVGATASYLSVLDAQDNYGLNGQVKYWF
jgi:hypothetical protein